MRACSTPGRSWSPAAAAGSRWSAGDVWDGVDAVIDKDYAAAELAHQLRRRGARPGHRGGRGAARLRQADPARLTQVDAAEAERHLADGQFPEGSMGPKVRAAIRFVRHGGRVSVITTAAAGVRHAGQVDGADESLGTRIVRDRRIAAGRRRHDR